MTDETKKRLPGIIERIDELRDEVVKIMVQRWTSCMRSAEKWTMQPRSRQLYGVYVWLDSAARALASY